MNDWEIFRECVPWFLDRNASVEVSATRKGLPLASIAAILFPRLDELLSVALATEISINGLRFQLLAWDSDNGNRMGWLTMPAVGMVPEDLHEDHKKLLALFGGIVERFNEPDSWLLNLNDALTLREAEHDGSFIKDYQWAFDNVGLALPIELTEYYSIAREANGNTTLCHRINGKILVFAPDHSFKYLTVLEGCPEYTLYKISGAAVFRDWVNRIALQWLSHTERSA